MKIFILILMLVPFVFYTISLNSIANKMIKLEDSLTSAQTQVAVCESFNIGE